MPGVQRPEPALCPSGALPVTQHPLTPRAIFRLRADGLSQAEISRRVGINQSTVLAILRNRAYLGLVPDPAR